MVELNQQVKTQSQAVFDQRDPTDTLCKQQWLLSLLSSTLSPREGGHRAEGAPAVLAQDSESTQGHIHAEGTQLPALGLLTVLRHSLGG